MKWAATAIALGFAAPAGAQALPYGPVDQPVAPDLKKAEAVPPCPPVRGDEVVVCGRPGEEQRLPIPEVPFGPDGDRIVRGELPRAVTRMEQQKPCGTLYGEICGGGVDILASAFFAAKVARKLIDPDWQAEPPPKIPQIRPGAEKFIVPVLIVEK